MERVKVTRGPRGTLYGRNYDGNALKRIPEWKATGCTSYEWQFNDSSLTVAAVYAYTGSYYTSGVERTPDEVPEGFE